MRIAARRLDLAARALSMQLQSSDILPDAVSNTLPEPVPRLAVNPKAMAAACALYAGQAARSAGRLHLAVELFDSVSAKKSDPEYAHYAQQSERELAQMERDAHVVMGINNPSLSVVSR
jgi:hypothetical protein